jgi:hypothetical protein
MEEASIWYDFLVLGCLLSTVIAYPSVAMLVTRPIQIKLRQTNEDHLSDWIIKPFQTGFYAMAVLIPFSRWRDDKNQHLVDIVAPVRRVATPVHWWLALWLESSMFCMVFLGLLPLPLSLFGIVL